MLRIILLCTAILIVAPIFVFAQDMINNFEKILIRNVTVIDQTKRTEDVVVSILIEQKKLELVSRDKMALSKADIAFDANGGFILGQLEVGNTAAFIILDQDPRTNVDVMLDTKTYAVFAVSKGEVVFNRLIRIDVDQRLLVEKLADFLPYPWHAGRAAHHNYGLHFVRIHAGISQGAPTG